MPQVISPMCSQGVTHITGDLAVACAGERAADEPAALGVGASAVEQRLLASLGKAGPVEPHFEPAADVPAAACAVR